MRIYREIEGNEVFYEREPVVVKTGLESWQGATSLLIYYHEGNTYVVTSGEFSNAEPTWTKGIVSIEDVLKDYVEEMQEGSE